jgi:WD40 repeat protein
MMRQLSMMVCTLACLCVLASSSAKPPAAEFITLPTTVPVTSFLLAQSGRIGAGFCKDGLLRVWALPEGRLLQSIEMGTNGFLLAAISRDGRLLATSKWDGGVAVWDTTSGKSVFQLRLPMYPSGFAFSRDNRYLAVASSFGRVQVFELAGKAKRCELDAVAGGTQAVVFSPDGARLATADSDTCIRIWDSQTGKLLASKQEFLLDPLTIDFTADGRQVVAASGDKVVVFFDAATGEVARRLKKQADPVGYVEVSGDGKLLATVLFNANNGSVPAPVQIWDTGSGRKHHEWWPPPGSINAAAWAADGHFLAATLTPEAVHIWRVY